MSEKQVEQSDHQPKPEAQEPEGQESEGKDDGQDDGQDSEDSQDAGSDDGAGAGDGEAAEQFEETPDGSEIEEIEKDREERLDPDKRPDNVEIDNTQRDFDAEKGMFTDSDDYDGAETRFPPASEQGT